MVTAVEYRFGRIAVGDAEGCGAPPRPVPKEIAEGAGM
jgi:hypothetical protein